MVVRKLLEYDRNFKNSDNYVIQDVPRDFKGTTTLKFIENFSEDHITFEINIPDSKPSNK